MTGFFRCVIAVTRIGMLYSSSATWPCDSPKGASGSQYSVSIRPSITISLSAGSRRSTVCARHLLFSELLVFQIVEVAARAADARRHANPQPVGGFERGAIGPHVLHAG